MTRVSGVVRAKRLLTAGLAGAAIAMTAFAIAPLQSASAVGLGQETASLPRALERSAIEVLAPRDAERYRRIFALQEAGELEAADREIAALRDHRLMGHVLYQRYMHPTAYVSRFDELSEWLEDYADHPGAAKIYSLAMKRKPSGAAKPQPPASAFAGLPPAAGGMPYRYRSPMKRSAQDRSEARSLEKKVRGFARRGDFTKAARYIDGRTAERLLDQVERDRLAINVAWAQLQRGAFADAERLAHRAASRSGEDYPYAYWVAGLAAWLTDKPARAEKHFGQLAKSERADDWQRSAGAFWAGRAALKSRNPRGMSTWLRVALDHPHTFYGLLARETLGLPANLRFNKSRWTNKELRPLKEDPRLIRAAALVQVGESELAGQEIMSLDDWNVRERGKSLLFLADRAQLPALALRLASYFPKEQQLDGAVTAALFPIPHWEPVTGFQVDRALLYALMRRESQFDPRAKSGVGARGLMQLMPTTAKFVAKRSNKKLGGLDDLYDPAVNMELAQHYLAHLMKYTSAGDDLFRLAAAYNGGPGNLIKWEKRMTERGIDVDDQLLFIEMLPAGETRLFIERVLANYWIYRMRLGQDVPSLAALAKGGRPLYRALD